jgi:DNA repair protein RecO (recombination protein O)
MREPIAVTGMVIHQVPSGEYDRIVKILTKEKGKITAFAKGARKPTGKLGAVTLPYCFGTFQIVTSGSLYIITEAVIENYFEDLHRDYEGVCYAGYFAEIATTYGQENNDEIQLLKLLYQTLRAILLPSIPNRLIKCIYELKILSINGELPDDLSMAECNDPKIVSDESVAYAFHYIMTSSIRSLYTFTVSEAVLQHLERIAHIATNKIWSYEFKSLSLILDL